MIGKEVIRRVAENVNGDNVCKSTEELLSRFEKFNKNRVENGFHKEKLVLASMDIKNANLRTAQTPTALYQGGEGSK